MSTVQTSASCPVAIVDYGVGNLRSIQRKLQRFSVDVRIASTAEEILAADSLIFPGVGHFANGMDNLNRSGLRQALEEKVLRRSTPVFGICLGMQLFAKSSEEGDAEGLGWIDARVVRFRPELMASPRRVPHVGWNESRPLHPSALFEGVPSDQRFYFTHSFRMECADPSDELARTVYGSEFTSAVQRGNILGVQFHPEKSHLDGLRVLLNFARG
jgi:glutamine amidotransferase